MNSKEILLSLFLVLITLTDFFIYQTISLSDASIVFFLFLILYKKPSKLPKQTTISICIFTLCLFLGFVQGNIIQFKSYIAAISFSIFIGLFSKINLNIYRNINFEKIVNLTLLILSFFTLIDFFHILIFNSSLNISGQYGNNARSFTGYLESGIELIRPCGIYPEPGDNTSIIAIFLSLKIYLNQKNKIKFFSKKNIGILFGLISIMVSRSNFGTLSLFIIVFYIFAEKIIKSNFINDLINNFTIRLYALKKKNIFLIIILLLIISFAVTFTLPRIMKSISKYGSVDITRFLVLYEVFNFDRGLIELLFGTSFEVPKLLINSTTQFINLFYQFGIFSFILFYVFFKPAFLHSEKIILFLLLVFLSKLNFCTIPFWLAIYFCNNEYQVKLISSKYKI